MRTQLEMADGGADAHRVETNAAIVGGSMCQSDRRQRRNALRMSVRQPLLAIGASRVCIVVQSRLSRHRPPRRLDEHAHEVFVEPRQSRGDAVVDEASVAQRLLQRWQAAAGTDFYRFELEDGECTRRLVRLRQGLIELLKDRKSKTVSSALV